MIDTETILAKLLEIVGEVAEPGYEVQPDSPLLGDAAILTSRSLVEMLLAAEEYADEVLGVVFDWTNDAALSRRRSPFRSPRALAEHLTKLSTEQGAN